MNVVAKSLMLRLFAVCRAVLLDRIFGEASFASEGMANTILAWDSGALPVPPVEFVSWLLTLAPLH